MSFADLLRGARESAASAFHVYLLQKKPDGIHVFLEGQDDESFYICKIRQMLPQGPILLAFRCGTKRSVYETRNKVRAYPKSGGTNLFFVDKDLDDILGIRFPDCDDIFVTECYSIENYLVSAEVLRIVWEEIFHLGEERALLTLACARFEKSRESFYHAMVLIMAWIVAAKAAGTRPNVNNIRLSNLLRINEDLKIESMYSRELLFRELEKTCGASLGEDTEVRVNEWAEKLRAFVPKHFVRGKFEAWFFLRFLRGLRASVVAALEGTKRISVRTEITDKNVIEVLAPRIATSPSLAAFLRSHLPRRDPGSGLPNALTIS